MSALSTPERLPSDTVRVLDGGGFGFLYDRDVFVSPSRRLIVSVEAAEDHSSAELQDFIRKGAPPDGWAVFFNAAPAPGVVDAIIRQVTR